MSFASSRAVFPVSGEPATARAAICSGEVAVDTGYSPASMMAMQGPPP